MYAAPSNPPAVEVQGVSKHYGAVHAVEGLDFTLAAGTTCGLLGGNGAGKTTTISMLLGLLLPSAGSIRVLGVDMLRNRHAVLARMNFSSPYVDLPQRLTVAENLRVYAHLYGVANASRRVESLAHELDLTALLGRAHRTLSSGQRTRVALAKALLNRPQVLLLDEPTASLDPDTADRMRTVLEDYQRDSGATVVLASHNMREVERMCGHVLMLRAGRVVDQGPPAALLARYGRADMEQVFLDIARERRAPERAGDNPAPERAGDEPAPERAGQGPARGHADRLRAGARRAAPRTEDEQPRSALGEGKP